MIEKMEIDKYCSQIVDYYTENFLEKKNVSVDELSSEIRNKLMLIEDPEQRKCLVKQVMEDLEEITLIRKYNDLYRSPSNIPTNTIPNTGVLHKLMYDFNRLM